MIQNKTRKSTISSSEIICTTMFSQMRGLMFRKKQNLFMIFPKERYVHLHNFFVFFPLDILVLDTEMKIVEIKQNFWPFTFWSSTEKGKYLLELAFPAEYNIGDLLKISSTSPKHLIHINV